MPVRSLTVDRVGAAEACEVDALDAVEVHGDGADVAGEPHAVAVGGDVDLSPTLEPLKSSRSSPPWPSTMSLVVAGIPLEAVVAAAEQRHVGAVVAVDDVVAAAAEERLRADAAEQRVVAVAAVDA